MAEAHEAVGQIHGKIFIEAVAHARAEIPGKVCHGIAGGSASSAVTPFVFGIVEGHAQAAADIGRQTGIGMNIIVQVRKQGRAVPCAFDSSLPAAIGDIPIMLGIATQAQFQLETQWHKIVLPEIEAHSQSPAQRKLIVAIHGTAEGGVVLGNVTRVLQREKQFGRQVETCALRGGHTRRQQGGKQRHNSQKAFHTFLP